jgi:hypothetical protein
MADGINTVAANTLKLVSRCHMVLVIILNSPQSMLEDYIDETLLIVITPELSFEPRRSLPSQFVHAIAANNRLGEKYDQKDRAIPAEKLI